MTYRDLSADYAFGVEEAYLLTVSETVITAPAGSVAEIPRDGGCASQRYTEAIRLSYKNKRFNQIK